jgi:preprotein translocase subunit SecG
MFLFVTVLQALVAAALVGVILMQRSEGGGLGVGGSPSGMLSARGAGDVLTKTTAILATLFVGLSILLAVMASSSGRSGSIDSSLQRDAAPIEAPLAPGTSIPLGDGSAPTAPANAPAAPADAAADAQSPASAPDASPAVPAVPLDQ